MICRRMYSVQERNVFSSTHHGKHAKRIQTPARSFTHSHTIQRFWAYMLIASIDEWVFIGIFVELNCFCSQTVPSLSFALPCFHCLVLRCRFYLSFRFVLCLQFNGLSCLCRSIFTPSSSRRNDCGRVATTQAYPTTSKSARCSRRSQRDREKTARKAISASCSAYQVDFTVRDATRIFLHSEIFSVFSRVPNAIIVIIFDDCQQFFIHSSHQLRIHTHILHAHGALCGTFRFIIIILQYFMHLHTHSQYHISNKLSIYFIRLRSPVYDGQCRLYHYYYSQVAAPYSCGGCAWMPPMSMKRKWALWSPNVFDENRSFLWFRNNNAAAAAAQRRQDRTKRTTHIVRSLSWRLVCALCVVCFCFALNNRCHVFECYGRNGKRRRH